MASSTNTQPSLLPHQEGLMVLVMHAGLTSTNAAQLVLESIASKVVQHVRVKQGVSGVAARSEPKYGVRGG